MANSSNECAPLLRRGSRKHGSATAIYLNLSSGFRRQRTPVEQVRIALRHGWAVVAEPGPTHPVRVKRLQHILDERWEELHGGEQTRPLMGEDDDLRLHLGCQGNRLGPVLLQPVDELEEMHLTLRRQFDKLRLVSVLG